MDDTEEPGQGTSADTFDPVTEAKRLLRSVRAGALGTLTGSGDPFSTLVTTATGFDGAPLILVSQLSAHTRHLAADGRCSLLLSETGPGDPLAYARLTVTGLATCVTDAAERARARGRFLARHPKAELYVDFSDFSFWRIGMDQIHLNGGFARAARFPAKRLVTDLEGAETLMAAEAGAIAHMNADHRDALVLYAQHLAGQPDGEWLASGLDPDGMDLACGDLTARVAFPERITTPGDLRKVLVQLAQAARAKVSAGPN